MPYKPNRIGPFPVVNLKQNGWRIDADLANEVNYDYSGKSVIKPQLVDLSVPDDVNNLIAYADSPMGVRNGKAWSIGCLISSDLIVDAALYWLGFNFSGSIDRNCVISPFFAGVKSSVVMSLNRNARVNDTLMPLRLDSTVVVASGDRVGFSGKVEQQFLVDERVVERLGTDGVQAFVAGVELDNVSANAASLQSFHCHVHVQRWNENRTLYEPGR